MSPDKIKSAVADAKRFIERAEVFDAATKHPGGYATPKESGALRRASMDLTRSLADMRRPA